MEEEFFNTSKAAAPEVAPSKASKHPARKQAADKHHADESTRTTPGVREDLGKAKDDERRTASPLPPVARPVPPPQPAPPTRIPPSMEPTTEPSKPAKMKFRPVVPKKNRRVDVPPRSPGPFRPLPDDVQQDEKQDVMVFDVPDDDDEEVDERTRAEGVVAIKWVCAESLVYLAKRSDARISRSSAGRDLQSRKRRRDRCFGIRRGPS